MAWLRDALSDVAEERSHWAGLPMPMEGARLIVEPRFPYAEGLMKIGAPKPGDDDGWRLRNSWYSSKDRCDILIMEREGKIDWGRVPAVHSGKQILDTLMCSDAWGVEQEQRALELLKAMITPRAFRHYFMTGMFIESSVRSGVTYIFRRLRPTIALAANSGMPEEARDVRILACLCMHPIAYYAGSWAGAMCPTDDVIAHLALMRGDEHMFWKRSNQHPAWRPEAGL